MSTVQRYGERAGRLPPTQEMTAELLAAWISARTANGYKYNTVQLGLYAVSDWATHQRGWCGLAQTPVVARAARAAR